MSRNTFISTCLQSHFAIFAVRISNGKACQDGCLVVIRHSCGALEEYGSPVSRSLATSGATGSAKGPRSSSAVCARRRLFRGQVQGTRTHDCLAIIRSSLSAPGGRTTNILFTRNSGVKAVGLDPASLGGTHRPRLVRIPRFQLPIG
jgi:hypothetical protein